ncbi:MAG: exodeoxyribonuclease VII small subunit [Xanthomonadales bacterium]|nr:exodeoxyribonuclease VII small subunit [Xanthomonadales bacterium]
MTSKNDNSAKDFETSLEQLEKLVLQMESGDLSLDESLAQFQQGVKLTRHCQQLLENAKQSVEKLLDVNSEDSAVAFTEE